MAMLWVFLILGSAILHAIASIMNKKIMQHEHALEYGALKSSFGLLLIFAFPFIELGYSLQTYLMIYGISLIATFGVLYYLKSIRHGDLSVVMPLMNLTPLFLLVVASVLLGEKVGPLALVGIFLLIIGTYFLQIGASKAKNFIAPIKTMLSSKHSLYMILVAIVFSLTATLEKGILNEGINAISLAVIIRFMMSVNFLAFDFIKYGTSQLFPDIKRDGKRAFLVSVLDIGMISLQYIALSLPGVLVSLVIPIKRLSTLFSTIAGGRMFHEKHLGVKIISCVVMLAGVVLIAIS